MANHTALSIANNLSDSLLELNVSFSRRVNSSALGMIADKCTKLKNVNIWGCTQLTNKFFDGHSNDGLEIDGAQDIRYK